MKRIIVATIVSAAACDGTSEQQNWSVGSCNDAASVAQADCARLSDQPCDIYKDVYEACREETAAGQWVRIGRHGQQYVPPVGWTP